MGISGHIREHVERIGEGKPFTSSELLHLGTRAAVDQVLSRLWKTGTLTRLSRGIYVRPKQNRFVGTVQPRPSQVVEVIARNTGAAVGVQGAEAARQLGLTTQVPSKTIFLTTGPSRNVMVGEVRIQLKHVAPRKLTLAGTPAGIALTALWYMGKSQVNPEVIAVIANKLTSQEFENLRSAKSVMPAWMTDAFYRYEQKQCG